MNLMTHPVRGLTALILCLASPLLAAANQLANHPSPYLALHAEDPVDWRDWQEKVFADARANNRLVYVSIGYFSCHWCHVMQQESYRDEAVAEILNRHYIAVKVDRELDPDLDQRLIGFVEKVRGSAGWPLNVFLTPDGYPVTGFTYLPRDTFAEVLQELNTEWGQNHKELAAAAQQFFQTEMQDWENQAFDAPQIPAQELIDAFVSQTMLAADEMLGGIGNTTKFPNVPQFDALLDVIERDPKLDTDVIEFVQLTLRTMASKHLLDHVNDGFFRYTTDPDWQTPHFEKMLYDNAQLASLYLRAHRIWPDAGYAEIALRTLDFTESSLKHPDGGYMSSLSAVDDSNREGGAYWWTREQLAAYLDAQEMRYLEGLWEMKSKPGQFLIEPLIGEQAAGNAEVNQRIRDKLRARGSRSMPADDKRLAAWNAMMLEALTAAASIEPRYRTRAAALYDSMRQQFYRADGSLTRLAGNAAVAEAVLEDYAGVALAFLNYGRAFDDPRATRAAAQLIERAHRLFVKDGRWQQKTKTLIPIAPGKWIIPDLVSFSPMSQWLKVALTAPGVDQAVRETAVSMLQRGSRDLFSAPYFYGSFIMLRVNHSG